MDVENGIMRLRPVGVVSERVYSNMFEVGAPRKPFFGPEVKRIFRFAPYLSRATSKPMNEYKIDDRFGRA